MIDTPSALAGEFAMFTQLPCENQLVTRPLSGHGGQVTGDRDHSGAYQPFAERSRTADSSQ